MPYLLLFLALFASSPLRAHHQLPHQKNFCSIMDTSGAGMFCVLNAVECYLYWYDEGRCAGVQVDFGTSGLYYDPARGPNWWEYYFEPVRVGSRAKALFKRCTGVETAMLHAKAAPEQTRQRIHEIINKYMAVKPHILKKVEDFVSQYFEGQRVIGVHYRGTDKKSEAPRVPYSDVAEAVGQYVEQLSDYRIFVATDEQQFITYMQEIFGDRILSIPAFRSLDTSPVHFNSDAPCQRGEEALVDCLLLSKTEVLIRCISHLSLWSSFFNPQLPVMTLNKGYESLYRKD